MSAHKHRTPRQSPTRTVNRRDLFDEAMKVEGQTMVFTVERKQRDDDPKVTFSPEALDQVSDAMQVWMGTRILRHMNTGKGGPKKMDIQVSVRFEGEDWVAVPNEKVPYFIADGSHRA